MRIRRKLIPLQHRHNRNVFPVAAWNCALDQSNMERQYALPLVDSTNAYLISYARTK